jgi:hypothetical protein
MGTAIKFKSKKSQFVFIRLTHFLIFEGLVDIRLYC